MKAHDFNRMNFYLEDNQDYLVTSLLVSTVRTTKTATCQITSKNLHQVHLQESYKKAMERYDITQSKQKDQFDKKARAMKLDKGD